MNTKNCWLQISCSYILEHSGRLDLLNWCMVWTQAMKNIAGPKKRYAHVAVNQDRYILVFGGIGKKGPFSQRVIWKYNIYTEQWTNHMVRGMGTDPDLIYCEACAASIGLDIYLFGGRGLNQMETNALWKLSKTAKGHFTWSKIKHQDKVKMPSPRRYHSGWEYGNKLWIFGGCGPLLEGYHNDFGDYI